MAIKFSNLASTTLASGVSSTATSVSVTSASSFPTLGSGDYFYATIGAGSGSEIVKVTGISGTTFTVSRGEDGTTAVSHSAGVDVALRVTAGTLEDLRDGGQVYTAGSGLGLSGNEFTNTAPDQTVSISGSGSTTVTGTYPSFTVSSTSYSHPSAHPISFITGLQTALDGKVDDSQVLTDVPANALFTDTVYTHPTNHSISFITGLQSALDGKVDDSQVLTNVPSGALFTDTVYTLPFTDNSTNWNTAYGWGDHSTGGYLTSHQSLSGYATETYVGTQISNLVDSSPAALNTLNELAAALGDDPNFATTVSTSIGTKLPLAGGTLTGTLAMGANAITSTGTISSGAITATGAINSIGTGRAIQVNGTTRINSVGDIIGTSYYVGGTSVIDTSRNLTNIGTLNGGTAWRSNNDGSGSGLDADLLDGIDSNRVVFGTNTSKVYRWDGDWNTMFTTVNTGFIDNASGTNGNPDGFTHHHGFQVRHDNMSNQWGYQFMGSYHPSYQSLYHRNVNAGTWSAWKEIWDSGNDGSGSGLDADLLDGQHGSYYYSAGNPAPNQTITLSGAVTGSGTTSITTSNPYQTSVTFSTNGPDSVMEYQQTASITDTKLAPSGDWYHSIRMGHGDPYSYYSNTMAMKMTGAGSGTLYTQVISNNSAGGWNKYWHTNNDGSGSGLDADTVDGIHGGSFLRSDTPDTFGSQLTSANNVGIRFVAANATDSNDGKIGAGLFSTGLNIVGAQTSSGTGRQVRIWGDVITDGGNKYWNAGNDGSGSGLDADLLDGLQLHTGRNNEVNKVVRTDANGYIQAGWINTISGATSGTARIYASDDGYIRYVTPTTFRNNLGLWWTGNDGSGSGLDADLLDGIDSTYFNRGDQGYGVMVGTSGWNMNDLFTTRNRAGFFDVWSGSNFPSGTTHVHGLQVRHNSSAHYGWQLAGQYGQNILWHRQVTNNSWGAWNQQWGSGNDGSGSGLDADLLDGRDSSSYVFGISGKGTTNAGFAGLTNANSGFYDIYNSGTPTGTWYSLMNMQHYGGNHGHQIAGSFYSAGDIYNRNNNNTSLSAWAKIWNTANDGSGSGLDADTVDGVQAASFLRSDATDYQENTIYQRGYLVNETGYRDRGVYGDYDSYKTNHIWSMGIAYKNHASGANFGNLYGLAYKHTNNGTGGTMAGGHMMVWCQNGTPYAAMGTNIWTSGTVYAASFLYNSDRAFKTNIKPIKNALSTVLSLRGVSYTLKKSGKNTTGFIAQEVEKVLPDMVDGDEGEKGVNYGQMVALLTEAMREQQDLIVSLQKEIQELKDATK